MVDQLIVLAQRDYSPEPIGLGSIREHPRNKGKRSDDRSKMHACVQFIDVL